MSRKPSDLIRLSESEANRLARLYMAAEREILILLDRAMSRGNDLRYLRSLLDNIQAILEDLLEGNRQWCEQAIPRVYVESAKYADEMVGKTIAGFGGIHQQAVKILTDNTFERLESVRQVIGRRSEDLYRQYALEATRQSIIGYKFWQQVARDFRDRLRVDGITGFRDKVGREWNMKTYAEMVARTTTMEAHLTGTANRLLEHGYDLVRVSSHPGSCEKCAPWQGRILSLTGKTPGYPTLEEAKADGLFHPNCRHAYRLYIDLDAEIEAAEGRANERLWFPGGPGARVHPDVIKNKYPIEQIIEVVLNSDWADEKALKQEYQKHHRDWARDTGIELTMSQFNELQEMVIQDPRSGVFYYVHRTAGPQLAFYAERIQYLGKLFKKVGLVYSIDKDQRVGFWHIKTGRRYFASQNDFVEIRPSKR
ncbi:MAG: phage minor capsid protein [Bacillota bacterium]|jgi:hypothetical protein